MVTALWQRILGGLVLGLLIIVGIFNIPVNQRDIITKGIDRYDYHRPIFADHTQAQDIKVSRGLQGIGALVVNLRHSPHPADIVMTVSNPTNGDVWRTVTIPGSSLRDDELSSATFEQPLTLNNQVVRITVSAPTATADTALGVRFHPDDVYPLSTRLENNQPKSGDLSLTLVERVPLWLYLKTTLTQNPERSWLMSGAVGLSLLAAVFMILFGWSEPLLRSQRVWQWVLLISIAVIAMGWRIDTIPGFKGVSGGDPYNYLFITKKIAQGHNPFANTKRLPGFPILLLPAYLTNLDDQSWMRGLSAVSAGFIILLVPVLARQLRLPWSAQVLAAVLLAGQKNFWEVSLRPEPYTFYALLVLIALILLYRLKSWPYQLALGLTLGYAAMTRQEGFVLAAVVALCTLFQWKKLWWRGFLVIYLPAFLLVLPFFINNYLTFGNPVFTQYFEGDRLQIVDSWPAFVDNFGATWGVLGSMWKPAWDQENRIDFTTPLFLTTLIITIVWNILKRFNIVTRFPKTFQIVIGIIGIASLIGSLWLLTTNKPALADWVMIGAAGVLVGSFVSFPLVIGWRAWPVWVVAITQGLIALWFHPFSKHFQQIYPLLMVMVATAIYLPSQFLLKSPRITRTVTSILWYVGLLTPLLLIILWLAQAWPTTLDQNNESTALDSVVYRAVRDARTYPGTYGVDQAYLPARVYFEDNGYYFWGDEPHTVADEVNWLQQYNIHTLVVTNNNPAFKTMPPGWQQVAHHKSAAKDDRIFESWVYVKQ